MSTWILGTVTCQYGTYDPQSYPGAQRDDGLLIQLSCLTEAQADVATPAGTTEAADIIAMYTPSATNPQSYTFTPA